VEKQRPKTGYRTVRMAAELVDAVQEIATRNRRPMTSQWRLILEMWQADHPDEVDPTLRKMGRGGK